MYRACAGGLPPHSAPARRLRAEPAAPTYRQLQLPFALLFSAVVNMADTQTVTWHHYNLDLRKLLHLRKLTLDMVIELPRDYQRMLSLRHVPLPLQQKLALVLNLHVEGSHTEAVQGIATVDSAWATLPAIASVMINLWYQRHIEASPRVRKESFVDVSEEFVQRMPLLTNRLADTGELRVLKCIMSSP
ncbi:hypothetical protein C8R45DRAFT_190420 [Mycena sanguinolenta]|nr:hypothetical protein C8R45DRAFT_190420 [Mycena sanguinolenta]